MTLSKDESLKNILEIITSKMVIPLYLSFWLLDIIYVPQYKWEFLVIRCSVIPCALIVNYLVKRATTVAFIEKLAFLYVFYLAAILHLMIYIVGPNALYYNCLHLVSIGSLSFIPFTRKYFGYTVLAIYGPYYLIELNHIETTAQYVELAVNSFIVFSIILITLIIKLYHDNFHQKEHELREELEVEYKKTKQAEQDLIIARDQAIAATEAKSSFVANMSHEIRTPLTAIIGFSCLLKGQNLHTEKAKNNINTVIKNSEHLLNIVNDILDFSKIEAQQLNIAKTRFSLFDFMYDTNCLIEGNVKKKGLDFEIAYHFPLPSEIDTDDVRLKQILINLTGNAAKFTAKGHVRIEIEYEEEKNQLIFSVKDTGIGMSEDQLSLIFNSFSQADSSISKTYGGTGLGLSISKQLSEKLGGDIQVSSEVGKGSCFRLYINPGNVASLNFVNRMPEVKGVTIESFDGLIQNCVTGNVLLVEDTIDNQVLISTYLEDMGAKISIANNGKECLELVDSDTFDLILMDMQMPVMDGIEALVELKKRQVKIPVVMLTGNALDEAKLRCSDEGCSGFITKPIDVGMLQKTVCQYLAAADFEANIANSAVKIEDENNTTPGSNEQLLVKLTDNPIISSMMGKSQRYDNLIFKFVDRLTVFVSAMEGAFMQQDDNKFASEAHRLKGVAGNYGFHIITEICQNIEVSIKQNNREITKNNIDKLKAVEQRIIAGATDYKSSH